MAINRETIETFLYEEAALLDEWKLDEWLKLFAAEGCYLVPPLDARDVPPERALHLVDDDRVRLGSRVKQLLSGRAYSESPSSRTRHSVTNVRFAELPGGHIRVLANFVVHRIRRGVMDTFVGRYEHELAQEGGELRFVVRKAILDIDALRPQGKVSFIL